MAHVEQRAKSFRVVWYEDGQRQRESFEHKSEAQRFVEALDANGGKRPEGWTGGEGYGDARTVAQLHAEWLAHQVRDSARAQVRGRFVGMIEPRPFAKERIGDVDTQAARDLARDLLADYEALTVREMVKNLRSMFNYAATREYVKGENPFPNGLIPEPKQSRAVFLHEDEVRAVVDALPAEWQPLARLLDDSGLRIGEAFGLRVRSAEIDNDDDGRVTLEIDKSANIHTGTLGPTKSRQTRYVTLSMPVSREIAALKSGRKPAERLFDTTKGYKTFQRVWNQAVRNAGLLEEHPNGVRIHDLRHTHASRMLRRGMDLSDVSQRLGHASIAITHKYYAHFRKKNKRINALLDG